MQNLIQRLRNAYDKIETIDPESPAYRRLIIYLNARTEEELKILAEAKIKFISSLARNRIRRP